MSFPYARLVILSCLLAFVHGNVIASSEFGHKRCPKGWLQYEEHCYLRQPDLLNFQEATRNCERHGADLFNSDDSYELEAIRSLFPDYYFTWVQSDVEEELVWLYEPYEEAINGKSSVARCIACYSSPNRYYNFYYPCTSRFHSICEKPLKSFHQWVQ
ncbi:unnamed protein product [Caenorhabditis sp. 36 PRJEB53466]|nr:unnamed protein product [Caenorhabditis sp. 36 PRJEB53466]